MIEGLGFDGAGAAGTVAGGNEHMKANLYPTYLQRDKFKYFSDSSDTIGVSTPLVVRGEATSRIATYQVAFASTTKSVT